MRVNWIHMCVYWVHSVCELGTYLRELGTYCDGWHGVAMPFIFDNTNQQFLGLPWVTYAPSNLSQGASFHTVAAARPPRHGIV